MSQCQIDAKGSFNRRLKKIDETVRERIQEKLELLKKNPHIGEPLKGEFKGLRKIRVGKYRVLYRSQPCHITLVSVRPRDSVYS